MRAIELLVGFAPNVGANKINAIIKAVSVIIDNNNHFSMVKSIDPQFGLKAPPL